MSVPALTHGDFTLPGEAGYEQLTLRLAKKWGADTIRDSDGTQLSPEIVQSGYAIYSTLCLVRSVQPAEQHPGVRDDRSPEEGVDGDALRRDQHHAVEIEVEVEPEAALPSSTQDVQP